MKHCFTPQFHKHFARAKYLNSHQNLLFATISKVIDWVEMTFTHYRKEMKGLEWGFIYNQFKDIVIDTAELEKEITALMADDDVKNKKGIYLYVLDRQEKHLNIRAFENSMRRSAYEKQKGICKKEMWQTF